MGRRIRGWLGNGSGSGRSQYSLFRSLILSLFLNVARLIRYQTLNEALDKFIIELIRGGFRLAKHRQSNKVEIKDLAFYLGTLRFILGFHYGDGRGIMADQNADRYHSMSIPGFDAVPPRRTHVPVDTEERRRLRAVIPRLARRDGGEAGAAAAVPNEALAGSTPDRGAASEAVQ